MSPSIKDMMLSEHRKIDEILKESEAKEEAIFKSYLIKLKDILLNHFLIEDEIISAIIINIKEKEVGAIFETMQEHSKIIEDINQILKTKPEEDVEDRVFQLQRDIRAHLKIEEKFFYNLIEKDLNENQKKFIITKLRNTNLLKKVQNQKFITSF
jgi:hemerythrin